MFDKLIRGYAGNQAPKECLIRFEIFQIAAFYAESLQSCGGQIIYPLGFLKKAFE